MSVLKTFSILFDTDAKKTEQEISGSLKRMTSNVLTSIGVMASFGAIAHQVFAATDYADNLNDFTTALDLNIEEVDAWGQAVKMSGGNNEEFRNTVGTLARDMAAFAATGRGRVAPFFKELGIHMTDAHGKARDVMQILPELADKFQGLTKQESFGLGQKLGLDQGTIMLLQSGRRAVSDLVKEQKELGVVTQSQADVAAKFNDEMDNTSHAFRTLFMAVGGEVLPILTDFLKLIQKGSMWIKEHVQILKPLGEVITIGLGVYGVGALLAFAKASRAAAVAAEGAAVAEGAMGAPLWLTIAALTAFGVALAVVMDDINVWTQGGESFIGKWVGSFQEFEDFVFPIVDKLAEKFKYLTGLWATLKEGVSMGVGDFVDFNKSALSIGKSMLGIASNSLIGSQTSSSIVNGGSSSNSSSTVNVSKIEVKTQATDANGIAKGIGGALTEHMAQTAAAFDNGVSH
jgi:hypothetical protein